MKCSPHSQKLLRQIGKERAGGRSSPRKWTKWSLKHAAALSIHPQCRQEWVSQTQPSPPSHSYKNWGWVLILRHSFGPFAWKKQSSLLLLARLIFVHTSSAAGILEPACFVILLSGRLVCDYLVKHCLLFDIFSCVLECCDLKLEKLFFFFFHVDFSVFWLPTRDRSATLSHAECWRKMKRKQSKEWTKMGNLLFLTEGWKAMWMWRRELSVSEGADCTALLYMDKTRLLFVRFTLFYRNQICFLVLMVS